MSDAEPPAISAPPPDWNAIESDVFCPLCDYNLRGLSEPRCPECGFRFDWPDILDPTRRLHPYIFEHHPERNFRSFWQTALAGWRPRRFWTSLHPAQPSRPRRLVLYWCLVIATLLFVASLIVISSSLVGYSNSVAAHKEYVALISASLDPADVQFRAEVISVYGSVQAFAGSRAPSYRQEFLRSVGSEEFLVGFVLPALVFFAWVALTFLTLLVFRWSMRRAKLRLLHVLRCVVYASDSMLWLGIVPLPFIAIRLLLISRSGWLPAWWAAIEPVCLLATSWLLPYRLWAAYRYYLRFDRPLLTVAASQIIVALIFLNFFVAWTAWF